MTTQEMPVYVDRARPGPAKRPHGRLATGLARVQEHRDRLFGVAGPEPGADRRTGLAYALFAVTVLFYAVHQFMTRGRWILDGSMWAEMATNYFVAATSPSLIQRLFALDVGYLPLPQRLIAGAGAEIGLAPGAVPYFYTGAAIVGAGLLIATPCLPVFRPVIASDGLRFALALALVLVPDFEARTFINFTYFAVIPAILLTALAAVRRDVPGWAWLLPLFMLSKPGVLAVLPAMVVVAALTPGRFRRITTVSAVVGLVQVVSLAVNRSSSTSLLQESDQSAFSKVVTAGKYTVGLIGRLLIGPDAVLGVYPWMFAGIALVLVLGVLVVLLPSRAAPLIPIGLSLVLFTMIVNSFSFSADFSRDMALLAIPGFDRRFLVAVIGTLFVAAAVVAMVAESPLVVRARGRLDAARMARVGSITATALFAGWFVLSGWLDYTGRINQPPGFPVVENSQWRELSPVLADPAEPVVCVPLDPFGWVAGRNCTNLIWAQQIPFSYQWSPAGSGSAGSAADADTDANSDTDPDAEADADATGTGRPAVPASYEVELLVPEAVAGSRLASLGVLVRPEPGVATVSGRAFVTTRGGDETVLTAAVDVPATGGLVQFITRPTPLIADVESVHVVFDDPVDVATVDPEDGPETVVVLWMGQPG